MRAVIIWSILTLLLFGLFPIVHRQENKCTSTETAFMIAKRFTVDREGLTTDDQPDFPWETPDIVQYEGSCTHRVTSWFERVTGGDRHRIDYAATVRFDPLLNKWSLLDWSEKSDSVVR